ncbi:MULTISPECIES: C40 family peptidase [Metabacillus]|uniref:Peptidase n=2 Tax=Metabacillus TaxID=2675233 RepID=A0A179T0W1_9BACI|nr:MULTISPECIES: C40 family peptidase [Metabacillus]OAS87607.1 peptidase [Metabacillus litoralis]QNF26996.1 C40 family peptidase [Metabacillus sp. KUDC1714]
MSKKKLLVMSLAVMIGLGSSFAIPSAKAETAESLSEIQQQRTQVQEKIENAEQELNDVQKELAKLNEQIERVDQAIADNNTKMEQTKKDITVANEEISKMQNEIAVLEETIKNRTEILKQRAIAYQHSGGNVDYFDVLVGSSSFSDFVNRAIAVGKIAEADSDLIKQHEEDQATLKETQAAKVKRLAELTEMKTELEGMQALVLEQKEQNDQLKEQLKSEESATLAAKASMQQQDSNLALQESSVQQSLAQAETSASTSVELTSGTNGESSNSKANSNSNSTSSSKKSTSSNKTVASTPVNPNGTVNDLIRAGYKYIGNSVYVFGGGRSSSDIANGRFDCSGFVNWAFSTVGVSLGGNTDSLKHAGTQVSRSNMQPGDLVFFNTYKTDGHVGIYVGGGKFIGSQSSTGVAIANMSSGYWAEKFNGRVVRVNL